MTQLEPTRKNTKAKVTFVGDPLKTFGILFNHAFPLDLSITKFCFQGCPFCFANANRKANNSIIGSKEDPTNLFIRRLQKANGQGYNPENLQEYCLRKKYPVIFSNNVDPFMPASEENYKIGERVLQACLEFQQPLFIQTKEVYYGDKVRDLLIQGKDLFQMYISLSTLNYDIAKKHETVAITPQERLDKVKDLTSHGVRCTLALNPYVPEWQPDIPAYFRAAKEVGADGVFAYPLHFTAKQKKVVADRMGEFTNMSDRYDDFYGDVKLMQATANQLGLKLYYPRDLENHDFYKGAALWSGNEEKFWPIDAHGFLSDIHETWKEHQQPVLIYWSDVDEYYGKFDEWNHVFSMNDFQSILAHDSEGHRRVTSLVGRKNKLKNVVRMIHNNPDNFDMFFGFYLNVFRLIETDSAGNYSEILDDDGDMIYVYDPTFKADSYSWSETDPENKGKELLVLEG